MPAGPADGAGSALLVPGKQARGCPLTKETHTRSWKMTVVAPVPRKRCEGDAAASPVSQAQRGAAIHQGHTARMVWVGLQGSKAWLTSTRTLLLAGEAANPGGWRFWAGWVGAPLRLSQVPPPALGPGPPRAVHSGNPTRNPTGLESCLSLALLPPGWLCDLGPVTSPL